MPYITLPATDWRGSDDGGRRENNVRKTDNRLVPAGRHWYLGTRVVAA